MCRDCESALAEEETVLRRGATAGLFFYRFFVSKAILISRATRLSGRSEEPPVPTYNPIFESARGFTTAK